MDAHVDEAGNLVATRGDGPRRLLLLGHLDTVPHHWPAEWREGELWARGSVDAKGSLANFLEVLAHADIPEDGQLRVVGAVEEEISSSKGAFHARDRYAADAERTDWWIERLGRVHAALEDASAAAAPASVD